MIDYERLYREQVRSNLGELIENPDAPWVLNKVASWALKFGYSQEEVMAKLRLDEMFACNFIKDPGRQNFHENLAAAYLAELDLVEGFKQLPKGSSCSKIIYHGMVMTLGEAKSKGVQKIGKSIDFEWACKGLNFFASHKYTFESGGSQDNQFHDLESFLRHASENHKPSEHFIAIADGPYYRLAHQSGAIAYPSKMEYLQKELCYRETLHACPIEEVGNLLARLLLTHESVI